MAANTVKHGTGGLNIDASRIGTRDNLDGGAYSQGGSKRWDGAENWRYKRGEHGNAGNFQQPTGRWPSNLILQHLEGCRCEGTRQVKPSNGSGKAGAGSSGFQSAYVGGDSKAVGFTGGSVAGDGKETVADWICAPGCSVDALDEQSGSCSPDTGGASRFFKQVGGKK